MRSTRANDASGDIAEQRYLSVTIGVGVGFPMGEVGAGVVFLDGEIRKFEKRIYNRRRRFSFVIKTSPRGLKGGGEAVSFGGGGVGLNTGAHKVAWKK